MADVIRFEIKGTPQLKRVLNRLGSQAPVVMGAALFTEAERIMAQSKVIVPVDMGELRASGHVQLPNINVGKVNVRFGYGGAAAPYALFVHEGTGPAVGRPAYFPPLSAIRGWVQRNIGPSAQDLDRVTYLVARAIGRKGLKPLKFLERPVVAAQAGMAGRLARHARKWLERFRAAG